LLEIPGLVSYLPQLSSYRRCWVQRCPRCWALRVVIGQYVSMGGVCPHWVVRAVVSGIRINSPMLALACVGGFESPSWGLTCCWWPLLAVFASNLPFLHPTCLRCIRLAIVGPVVGWTHRRRGSNGHTHCQCLGFTAVGLESPLSGSSWGRIHRWPIEAECWPLLVLVWAVGFHLSW